jgi:hypothetical protein
MGGNIMDKKKRLPVVSIVSKFVQGERLYYTLDGAAELLKTSE